MNRHHILCIGYWYANFIESNSIENFQSLPHIDKISRIVEVEKGSSKFRCLTGIDQLWRLFRNFVSALTLSRRRCQKGSHSWPAASMHSFTAAARSGRMLRILSSAFGDRREKFSQASYRIAEGEVDPGRNTETDEARPCVAEYELQSVE